MSCLQFSVMVTHRRNLPEKPQPERPWSFSVRFMTGGSCSYSHCRSILRTVLKQLLIPSSSKGWKGSTTVRVPLVRRIASF